MGESLRDREVAQDSETNRGGLLTGTLLEQNTKMMILKEGTTSIYRRVNGFRSVAGGRLEQRQETSIEGISEERTSLNMTKVEKVSDHQHGEVDQT